MDAPVSWRSWVMMVPPLPSTQPIWLLSTSRRAVMTRSFRLVSSESPSMMRECTRNRASCAGDHCVLALHPGTEAWEAALLSHMTPSQRGCSVLAWPEKMGTQHVNSTPLSSAQGVAMMMQDRASWSWSQVHAKQSRSTSSSTTVGEQGVKFHTSQA